VPVGVHSCEIDSIARYVHMQYSSCFGIVDWVTGRAFSL